MSWGYSLLPLGVDSSEVVTLEQNAAEQAQMVLLAEIGQLSYVRPTVYSMRLPWRSYNIFTHALCRQVVTGTKKHSTHHETHYLHSEVAATFER